LGYHVAHFMSKQQAKNSEPYTVIDRPNVPGLEVVMLVPSVRSATR
jgi:hypothetical protein